MDGPIVLYVLKGPLIISDTAFIKWFKKTFNSSTTAFKNLFLYDDKTKIGPM